MSSSFSISNNPWDFDYAVYFRTKFERSVAYAEPVRMFAREFKPEVQENPEPMMRLRKDELQQLMDELWRVGLRPSEGTGSAGALAATERHLEDMRKLAMNHLAQPPIR
jgi:hypothetical protein